MLLTATGKYKLNRSLDLQDEIDNISRLQFSDPLRIVIFIKRLYVLAARMTRTARIGASWRFSN